MKIYSQLLKLFKSCLSSFHLIGLSIMILNIHTLLKCLRGHILSIGSFFSLFLSHLFFLVSLCCLPLLHMTFKKSFQRCRAQLTSYLKDQGFSLSTASQTSLLTFWSKLPFHQPCVMTYSFSNILCFCELRLFTFAISAVGNPLPVRVSGFGALHLCPHKILFFWT